MSFHVHTEYAPPRSWEQFEELCADIFQEAWRDPALVRHGRAGQRQNGVDIVARNGAHYPVGLQCKRRSRWPLSKLSKQDIDTEVKEALTFSPALKSFYILTTAPDDAALLGHVRKINQRHEAEGLFDVVLLGWSELVRRACLEPRVVDKHFGHAGGGSSRSPLLATWMMTGGKLELCGEDLRLGVQELALDLQDWPTGHVAIRQRESDKHLEMLRAFEGKKLSYSKRRKRIELRNQVHRLAEEERLAQRAVKLMLTDPDLSGYILKVWEGEAHFVVAGFLNEQVARLMSTTSSTGRYLRLHWPDDFTSHIASRLTTDECLAISERSHAFKRKYGKDMCEVVGELPAEVRARVAIPRIVRGLLERLDETRTTWDQLRDKRALELGSWRYSID